MQIYRISHDYFDDTVLERKKNRKMSQKSL